MHDHGPALVAEGQDGFTRPRHPERVQAEPLGQGKGFTRVHRRPSGLGADQIVSSWAALVRGPSRATLTLMARISTAHEA